MLLKARPGPRLKVGYMNESGWAAYLREGVLFVRRFRPAPGRRHPDLGCNVEVYCGDRYLELELLGPLTELSPGSCAVHTERWEVLVVGKTVTTDDVRQVAVGVAPAGGHPVAARSQAPGGRSSGFLTRPPSAATGRWSATKDAR